MKSPAFIALAAALLAFNAAADCHDTGKGTQRVFLSYVGRTLERWEVDPKEIHRIKLPNDFQVGIRVEPATPEFYRESLERSKAKGTDELVKISVFDASQKPPKLLTHTYGGANSRQGYSSRGGADRVEALGDPGIELWLHKPACILPADVAAK